MSIFVALLLTLAYALTLTSRPTWNRRPFEFMLYAIAALTILKVTLW